MSEEKEDTIWQKYAKSSHISFYLKMMFSKLAQNDNRFLGNFFIENLLSRPSKIAQSGHTGPGSVLFLII